MKKFGEGLKKQIVDMVYVKELENDLELMKNQMTYLENRCEQLKNENNELMKLKSDNAERMIT